jgi:hypothetical protein
MTNFELLNQIYNDYFGIDMKTKNKEDEEIEMHVESPSGWGTVTNTAVNTSNEREAHDERVQTCERAICGVLDRLDAIEAQNDQIFSRLASVEEYVRSMEGSVHELKHKRPAPIFEELESRGLAERCDGVLVLTMKGRQVASLFDNGEIEDIRE